MYAVVIAMPVKPKIAAMTEIINNAITKPNICAPKLIYIYALFVKMHGSICMPGLPRLLRMLRGLIDKGCPPVRLRASGLYLKAYNKWRRNRCKTELTLV